MSKTPSSTVKLYQYFIVILSLGLTHLQSTYINKSLFTLRKCIASLASARMPPQHVPYRDSKLTSLLQPALGGNAHAVLLACLAPLAKCLDDNVSTLQYAALARKVSNKVSSFKLRIKNAMHNNIVLIASFFESLVFTCTFV